MQHKAAAAFGAYLVNTNQPCSHYMGVFNRLPFVKKIFAGRKFNQLGYTDYLVKVVSV